MLEALLNLVLTNLPNVHCPLLSQSNFSLLPTRVHHLLAWNVAPDNSKCLLSAQILSYGRNLFSI